jgi:hypothetical protein
MTFTTPLGLVALLAIPAIVVIHLFRRRFPMRPIAGLFLWQAAPQVPHGGRTIARLPVTRSLVLECLAALALALILAGARIFPATSSDHLVVLLDDSASMAAVNAAGESARDRAVRRVLLEIERLGVGGRITIIASGDRPAVLAGPAALAPEGPRALERWAPRAPHHSLALGLRLARELAADSGKLLVVSDAVPPVETRAADALWISVGTPLANVGIVAAGRSLSPEQGRGAVTLTLANHSDAVARRQLVVLAQDKQVLARQLDVPPGISSTSLPLPTGLPAVRVTLSGDALARDNEVILVEPRSRVVGVGNDLTEGRGRQALTKALSVLSGVTQAEAAHLRFVEAAEFARPATQGVWRVGFGTPPGRGAAGEPEDFIGPFVMEKRHPLLAGVSLAGVVWAGASPVATGAVRPIVSAGEQAIIGSLAGSPGGADTDLLFNVDLGRTNLIRSPDWPILISNLVEMRRLGLPGPDRWNYRVGEWVRGRLGRSPKAPLRLRGAGVDRQLPSSQTVEFLAPTTSGLVQVLEGPDLVFEIGVNFLDETEANLRDRVPGEEGELSQSAAGIVAESGPASDPLFWVLLATVAIAIAGNWYVLGHEGSRA